MGIVLYGIPNCDTVRKARAWLQAEGLDYRFHDFKKEGVPPEPLQHWIEAAGWERLVNRQGTTWRKLDGDVQAAVTDAPSAARLMQAQPSVIKRPVVDWGQKITVGFDPSAWALLARP